MAGSVSFLLFSRDDPRVARVPKRSDSTRTIALEWQKGWAGAGGGIFTEEITAILFR